MIGSIKAHLVLIIAPRAKLGEAPISEALNLTFYKQDEAKDKIHVIFHMDVFKSVPERK